ncbi:MAG: efflux RND transporter permease subunit [Planctomycetota bacterium]
MWDLYYRQPRLLVLTLLLILVAGLSAWFTLPRREDPELTGRTALVFTRFPGADAERVESLVTERIEDELDEIEEIREVASKSQAGISIVTIELKDEITEPDEVWSRTRDKIDDARALFPAGVSEPDFEAFTIDAYTIITAIVWESGEPNQAVLRRLGEALEDELRAVDGTKEADLFGENSEEIVIEANAETLAARGLTAADVAAAVRGSDSKVAAGQVRGRRTDLLLEVEGELDTLDRIRQIPVRYGVGDDNVRVEDLATVRKTIVEPAESLALVDGKTSIVVAARMQSGRRVDQWTADAKARIEAFRATLPRGLRLDVIFDQSRYTDERMGDLLGNLGLGAVLVFVVIFFMMGWRSALLVGAALPLASLMVLGGMSWLGVPLHQMSITGLIIALGLLIDSAIVMVDEVRHQRGSVAGAVKKMAVPLLASTFTTALAFMPLLLGAGPVGEFVGPMAVTVILAIASALFLALTVTPALAGLLDRANAWHGFQNARMLAAYRSTLGFIFRRPILAIALAVLLPVIGFTKGAELEQQFFPPTDRDQFPLELRLPPQASIQETAAVALAARDAMLEHDAVQNVHWFVGQSAPKFYYNMVEGEGSTPSYAQALVQLEPGRNAFAAIRELQTMLDARFPAAQFIAKQIEQGPPFDAPIEVRVYGPDLDRLRDLGETLRAELAKLPGITHTRATLAQDQPKLWLQPNEERANLAGFDRVTIARQLDAYTEGAVGGSVLEATEELPVRVRMKGRGEIHRIANLDLVDRTGAFTPLSAIATLRLDPSLSNLPHHNGRRVNTVQGFLKAGTLPEAVLGNFRERAAAFRADLPPGYDIEFGGEAEERGRAQSRLFESAGVLVVLILATLVLSFNSFRLAAVIGSVAILCAGLAMGSLWIFDYPFGFMAIVGTMGLVGVAINDAIVVLADIRADPKASAGDPDAVRDVVVRATRHVLSTTVTTGAGFLPLILAGGGFWPPLAVSIVGGVAGATLLALYFVPAAYLIVRPRANVAVLS